LLGRGVVRGVVLLAENQARRADGDFIVVAEQRRFADALAVDIASVATAAVDEIVIVGAEAANDGVVTRHRAVGNHDGTARIASNNHDIVTFNGFVEVAVLDE